MPSRATHVMQWVPVKNPPRLQDPTETLLRKGYPVLCEGRLYRRIRTDRKALCVLTAVPKPQPRERKANPYKGLLRRMGEKLRSPFQVAYSRTGRAPTQPAWQRLPRE